MSPRLGLMVAAVCLLQLCIGGASGTSPHGTSPFPQATTMDASPVRPLSGPVPGTWTEVCASQGFSGACSPTPPPLDYPAEAYDPINNEVVLFGGLNTSLQRDYGYTFAFVGGATGSWVNLTSSLVGGVMPGPRDGATMTYDPGLHALVLVGGRCPYGQTPPNTQPGDCEATCDNGYVYCDTWTFVNDTWTEIGTGSSQHYCEGNDNIGSYWDPVAYDYSDGYLLCAGGYAPEYGHDYTTYELTNAGTWQTTGAALPFSPNSNDVEEDSMVWDPADGYVLFGALNATGGTHSNSNFFWKYRDGAWTDLHFDAQSSDGLLAIGKELVQLIYDPAKQIVVQWGGYWHDGGTTQVTGNDLWYYRAGVWTNVSSEVTSSPSFYSATYGWSGYGLAVNPEAGGFLLYGGYSTAYDNYGNAIGTRSGQTWWWSPRITENLTISMASISGLDYHFNASTTDGAYNETLTWLWGDGSSTTCMGPDLSCRDPSHTYSAPGTYTVVAWYNSTEGAATAETDTYSPPSISNFAASPASLPLGNETWLNSTLTGGTEPYIEAFTSISGFSGLGCAWRTSGPTATATWSDACIPLAPGHYNVTLWVNDSADPTDGGTSVHETYEVNVWAPPAAPGGPPPGGGGVPGVVQVAVVLGVGGLFALAVVDAAKRKRPGGRK